MRHTWRRWWTVAVALLGVAGLVALAYVSESEQSLDVPESGPVTTPQLQRSEARVRFPAGHDLAGFSDSTFQEFGLGTPADARVTASDTVAWARGAGATLHRMGFDWNRLEPRPGQLNEAYRSQLADFAEQFQSAGGRVMIILAPAASWAREPGACLDCPAPPADTPQGLAAWARYVREAARTFPEAAAFEIWNEPNLTQFWGRKPPQPDRYARLANAAIAELRRSAPGTRILVGSLATVGEGADGMAADEFLRAAVKAGLDTDVNAVSYHAYTGQNDRRVQDPDGENGYRELVGDVRRAIRQELPKAREWITETGITRSGDDWGVSPEAQARGLLEVYNSLALMPRVDAVLIHQLFEHREFPASSIERGFGVVVPQGEGDQQALPAWCALRAAAVDAGPPPLGAVCKRPGQ